MVPKGDVTGLLTRERGSRTHVACEGIMGKEPKGKTIKSHSTIPHFRPESHSCSKTKVIFRRLHTKSTHCKRGRKKREK